MSENTSPKPNMIPNILPSDSDDKQAYFSITQFVPITEDFYFFDDHLVILSPFEVIWEAPVLARSLKSLEEHIQYIQNNKIEKAFVIAEDISFLRRCPDLKSLQIIPPYSASVFDYSPLYDMPNLQELNAQTIYGPKNEWNAMIDYSRLPNLETLSVGGKKGHQNLTSIKALRKLHLGQGQPTSRSLADFDFCRLEELALSESQIRSLEGLEKATRLRKLSLTYCRTLEDITSLTSIGDTLTSLEIESCNKIKDFECLKKLLNLEELTLNGSNPIPNLDFLENMKKLKSFRFTMNILDGDLSLCKNIPDVYCQNRKHYNLKNENLPKEKMEP